MAGPKCDRSASATLAHRSRPPSSSVVAAGLPYLIAPLYRFGRAGLDADAVALCDRRAGRAHVRAARPHRAGSAAHRHRRRGRQLLPQSRHRSRRHARGLAEGRRTISTGGARRLAPSRQQTAKNLFLWQGRSFVRKALEIPLALWLNMVLPKRRVLEIYLNIAEWGPNGEFGAEAAARYAFGKSAHDLTPARRPNSPPSCPIRFAAARGRPAIGAPARRPL